MTTSNTPSSSLVWLSCLFLQTTLTTGALIIQLYKLTSLPPPACVCLCEGVCACRRRISRGQTDSESDLTGNLPGSGAPDPKKNLWIL